MIHKVTVGLQQKIGQPNFGSIGASCSIKVQLDDDVASAIAIALNRNPTSITFFICFGLNDHKGDEKMPKLGR